MPTRNINLTDHFDRFIDERVTSGRYGNASEIVREGLRLLEKAERENQEKLKALKKAARVAFAAIDQGEGIVLRGEQALEAYFNSVETRVARNTKKSRNS